MKDKFHYILGQNHIHKLPELSEKKNERKEKHRVHNFVTCTLTSELWLKSKEIWGRKKKVTDKVRKVDYQVEEAEKPCPMAMKREVKRL